MAAHNHYAANRQPDGQSMAGIEAVPALPHFNKLINLGGQNWRMTAPVELKDATDFDVHLRVDYQGGFANLWVKRELIAEFASQVQGMNVPEDAALVLEHLLSREVAALEQMLGADIAILAVNFGASASLSELKARLDPAAETFAVSLDKDLRAFVCLVQLEEHIKPAPDAIGSSDFPHHFTVQAGSFPPGTRIALGPVLLARSDLESAEPGDCILIDSSLEGQSFGAAILADGLQSILIRDNLIFRTAETITVPGSDEEVIAYIEFAETRAPQTNEEGTVIEPFEGNIGHLLIDGRLVMRGQISEVEGRPALVVKEKGLLP